MFSPLVSPSQTSFSTQLDRSNLCWSAHWVKVISVSGGHPCKHSSKKKQIALSSEQQQLIERFCKALVPSIGTSMSSWTQLATKTPTGASSYEASHAHAPPTHQAWGWIPQLGSQPQTIGCPRMHPKLMELHSNAAGACRQPQVGELCNFLWLCFMWSIYHVIL